MYNKGAKGYHTLAFGAFFGYGGTNHISLFISFVSKSVPCRLILICTAPFRICVQLNIYCVQVRLFCVQLLMFSVQLPTICVQVPHVICPKDIGTVLLFLKQKDRPHIRIGNVI